MTGIVKFFDPVKGLGTIVSDLGREYFFRYTSLPKLNGKFVPLHPGEKVQFDIEQDMYYGEEAVNIHKIG